MVIVKAFDQAIWYLKIIFAWGHSVCWIYLCNYNLATTSPILRVKCKPATKGLNKHIYNADGQTVIPPVSQSGNQSARQPVGRRAHKDMWALHPLPQWCRSNVSWLWSSKAEMYRGPLTEDMHQATLNLFFYPFFLRLSSIIAFPTSSHGKNKNTGIWKAADYMKYILDFHIEMRCSSSFCGLCQIWCQTDYST